MEYLIAPVATLAQWAGIAYIANPGVCEGVATVVVAVALWVSFQVALQRAAK